MLLDEDHCFIKANNKRTLYQKVVDDRIRSLKAADVDGIAVIAEQEHGRKGRFAAFF
jgi:hypothetical protein